MDIQTGDTPQAGPLSIDDVLNGLEERPAPTEDQEEQSADTEVEETEEEVEVAETEEETDDVEPDTEDEGGPEVYAIAEYGETVFLLDDGSQVTANDLVKGRLMRADYTRKSQENANVRRQNEEIKRQLDEREAALVDKERQLNEQYASLEEPEPDWAKIAEEDPLSLPLKQIEWQKKQAEKAAKKAEVEAQEEAERKRVMQVTSQMALEVFPEWATAEGFQKDAALRKETALAAKFTEQDYAKAIDFRMATLLQWAAIGRQSLQKINTTQKKIAKAPKVVKPGTSVSKADKEQAARAAKRKQRSGPMTMDQMLNTIDYT